ncbi:MAG TPA: hypothetical protein VKX29_02575 [Brumimicrobium sp.]|nr:hypothetical protein [Brumimicrobium sp.]
MNKILLSTLGCLLAVSAYSQDKLYTHKGDTLNVYVKEVNESSIRFTYPNEQSINTLSKNATEKIEYESGRVQQITEKIIINDYKDWEKVVITNLESDVQGLTKGKEMKAKAKGTTFTSQGRVEARAFDKLKKEAASKGYHTLLILTTTGKSGSPYSSASSSIRAIGYTY